MARSFASTSSQYLTASAAPTSGLPLTLAAWVWPDSAGTGERVILSTGDNAAVDRHFAITSWQDKLIATHQYGSGAFSQSAATWSNQTWHHCVGVFASTTSRIAYLNNTAATENTTSKTAIAANQTRIGTRANGTTQLWNGRIAHAAVWNVALTAAEVSALYNSGIGADPRSIRPDALVAYWPLLENDGDIDWWRNTHLTPTNAPTYAQHPPVLMKSRPTVVVMGGSSAPTISSVTISGTRVIGETLTASVATSPASVDSIAYQWEASSTGVGAGTDITGATASTLALTYDDFGPYLDTAAYVRCGAIATVGVSSSDQTFSDWQTVTVPSGGAAGGSLLESSLIR